MRILNQTLSTPEENLACDEALLLTADESDSPSVLRFWESSTLFVVLGHSNKMASETYPERCLEDGIPILRRCSGGGTIMQGPGCLNYGLVLRMNDHPELQDVTATNRFIMERHRRALSSVLQDHTISIEGHTDLAIDGLKFSGNAQRRKKTHLLFHGTFLVGFDLAHLTHYLPSPGRQPNYREQRSHQDFVTNLPCDADELIQTISEAWNATAEAPDLKETVIQDLVWTKYGQREWNEKF